MPVNSDSDGVPDGNVPAGDDGQAREAPEGASADDGVRGQSPDPSESTESADDADVDRMLREELEPAAVGARVPAGSARAAARASAARAGVSAGKGRATPSRDRGPRRGNIFVRIARYLREVVSEMRKVIWPTRKEMITYSIVVVLFLVFMIAMTWGLDLGFAKAVLAIFG